MRVGKITENALKRSVLKQIRTEYKGIESAAVGTDCAFSNEKKTFSAIYPVTEDISDPGLFAVMKAANSLIAQGIKPDHVSLSILLPADAEEKELKKIVADALTACKMCGTVYGGGHSEVTTIVTKALVTATATGIQGNCEMKPGPIQEKSLNNLFQKPRAGQSLVITKWIALEGTAMIAAEKKNELSTRYPVPFIEKAESFKALLDIREEARIIAGFDGVSVHDISSGGVFAALWEMAQRAGCGLNVELKKIPLRQETIEICEFFELNPYEILSGGSLLIATNEPEALAGALQAEGIPAALVGRLVQGNDKIIINDDERRFLELPQSDEIHKIL